MASTATPTNHGLARYWPFGLGGLAGPLLAVLMSRWMPFYVAVGASMFIGFATAVWIFKRGSGRSLAAGVASGLAAGLVGGGLAFLFPWR
jgi:hypothetical protein